MHHTTRTEAFPRAQFSLMHAEVFLRHGSLATDASERLIPRSDAPLLLVPHRAIRIRYSRTHAHLTFQ